MVVYTRKEAERWPLQRMSIGDITGYLSDCATVGGGLIYIATSGSTKLYIIEFIKMLEYMVHTQVKTLSCLQCVCIIKPKSI